MSAWIPDENKDGHRLAPSPTVSDFYIYRFVAVAQNTIIVGIHNMKITWVYVRTWIPGTQSWVTLCTNNQKCLLHSCECRPNSSTGNYSGKLNLYQSGQIIGWVLQAIVLLRLSSTCYSVLFCPNFLPQFFTHTTSFKPYPVQLLLKTLPINFPKNISCTKNIIQKIFDFETL